MRFRPSVQRPAVAAAALLLTTAVLGACSSSDDSTDTSSTGTSAAASDQFPVTIDTKFGDVTVDSAPQRVVALGWGDAETALALGVQPIGASDWLAFGGTGVGPWAADLYDTPPELIGTTDPSFEQVAALEPDLILDTRASGDQARYDTLAKIGVPVVSVPEGGDDYLTTWQQQLDIVGKALGKSDKAAQLETELKAKFDSAASANPEFAGKTVAVGARFGDSYGAYVSGDSRVDFMKALGFVNKPELDALSSGDFYVPVSTEQLVLFDADLTVIFPIDLPASSITGDPVFAAVPSVAAGHDVVFDDVTAANAFSSGTTLGLTYALDTAVPLFTEALNR